MSTSTYVFTSGITNTSTGFLPPTVPYPSTSNLPTWTMQPEQENPSNPVSGTSISGRATGNRVSVTQWVNDRRELAEREARDREWATYEEPRLRESALAIEQEALNEANRALAEMQARYGYMRSAGAGTAGMWQMGQYGLEGKAMAIRTAISTLNEQYMRDAQEAWYKKEDDQSFREHMLELEWQYREQYAEKIAELNGPSWWEAAGSIVGTIAGYLNLPSYNSNNSEGNDQQVYSLLTMGQAG